MASNTQIPTLDNTGSIPAYIAKPEGTPRGAIIVIQEIFGVNEGIVKKTNDWAAAGYLAIAPDVFWRQKPGIELNPDVPEEFQEAIGYMMQHDFIAGLSDIKALLSYIRGELGIAKVGLVGFCMGGKIAYESAAHTDIDAAVGYYGVGINQMLDAARGIKGQLLLHIPTNDGFVPPAAQKAMHDGLSDNRHVTMYNYEGLDHGFADTFGLRRNEGAAQLADKRTTEFFAQYVG